MFQKGFDPKRNTKGRPPVVNSVATLAREILESKKKGEKSHEASFENVMNGSYPLSRTLYIYVAKEPNKPMPAQTAEFLKYILSKAGQEIVVKDGFLPLPAKVVEKELAKLK